MLFVSGAGMPDYQCDMLLHGLRELLGTDVVDVQRVWYLYAGDFADGSHDKAALYGRGFTMYGLLGDDSAVDRTDIEAKIARRFYDLIIYGSVRRCTDHIDLVLHHYPATSIVFVDGEDDTSVVPTLVGRGLYLKRELLQETPRIKPIHFAIPKQQIATTPTAKTRVHAHIDPNDRSTYIYADEAAYYRGYAESFFGLTQKKAGWDCLRHYEIMANGCIPDFRDIESCPIATMVPLPKHEFAAARRDIVDRGPDFVLTPAGRARWDELWRNIDKVLRERLTTIALARYVLDAVAAGAR